MDHISLYSKSKIKFVLPAWVKQENIPQDELKTTNWKYEYKDNEELSEKISKIDQKIR